MDMAKTKRQKEELRAELIIIISTKLVRTIGLFWG